MAKGVRNVAAERNVNEVAFLEYEVGTRDFGAVAARIKEADPDLLFVGCLGVEGNQLLEAMSVVNYMPKRHFYLYPSGVLASYPPAERATSLTNFEDVAPYISAPEAAAFAKAFDAAAKAQGLPYPYADSQAGYEYSGWQILDAAVKATNSIEDKVLAEWLEDNWVDTISGRRNFKGKFHTSDTDLQQIRQVQNGRWVAVYPTDRATPGVKLIAP
jgi:branched-chain amino acid transport system substrate-binding protein